MFLVDKHKKLKKIISLLAYPTGASIIDDNFKITFRTYFGIFLCVLYFVSTSYTLYVFSGQFDKIIECLCVCSGAAQGATKYFHVLSQTKKLTSHMKFIDHLYDLSLGNSQKRKEIFSCWIKRLEVCTFLGAGILCSAIAAIILCPVYYYFYSGERQLMLVVYLPFVDITEDIGYTIHLFLQCLWVIVGGCGNVAADVFFSMQIMHIPIMVSLLELAFEDIETSLSKGGKPLIIKRMLRNAMIMHQDIMSYVESIDQSYGYTIFLQITSSTGALSITLFNIVTSNWLAAYGYCIMSLGQLFIYCVLGTFVEIMNDKTTNILYAVPWHLLPPSDQKMIGFCLGRSHRARELTIAGLAPLNVATGASLLKAVYTYLMMLLNFME